MPTINPTREQIKALMQELPDNQPIVMINLLKFKTTADDSALSGESMYAEYAQQTIPFLKKAEGQVVWVGKPQLYVIGKEEDTKWDKVLLVKYPSKNHFLAMIQSEGYPADLRTRALEDSKLIASLAE